MISYASESRPQLREIWKDIQILTRLLSWLEIDVNGDNVICDASKWEELGTIIQRHVRGRRQWMIECNGIAEEIQILKSVSF